jgi:S-(hydroxymethyl)glutathione dehydrogenase / alcohol dehydrogenase
MRAAVLVGYGKPMEVEDVEPVALGPRSARVRIDASGICHSDVTVAAGGLPSLPQGPPMVLGHEAAGTVVEVGPDVARVRVGDRVIVCTPSCGSCAHCLVGRKRECELHHVTDRAPKAIRSDGSELYGLGGMGLWADEFVGHEAMLVKVETDLPAEHLALISCGVATGVGAALYAAAVEPGATVAVYGCGGVGQSIVQGARACGAGRIFAVDPIPAKRDAARTFGATDTIDPGEGDAVEQIRDATGVSVWTMPSRPSAAARRSNKPMQPPAGSARQ